MSSSVFHRTGLAERFAREILLSDAPCGFRNGLFLFSPWGTGKSTFIREDLVPALERRGAWVVSVELYETRSASPAMMVEGAVRDALRSEARLKSFNPDLERLELSFRPEKIGRPEGPALSEVFAELTDRLRASIVLIIDGADELPKSRSGNRLLRKLAAARDAVKTSFFVIGLGSHRMRLREAARPFHGADFRDFPLLGDDYLAWERNRLQDLGKMPSSVMLRRGFELLGFRPWPLHRILEEMEPEPGQDSGQTFLEHCSYEADGDSDELFTLLRRADRATRRLFTEIARSGPKGCAHLFSRDFLEDLTREEPLGRTAVSKRLKHLMEKDLVRPAEFGRFAAVNPRAAARWLEVHEEDPEEDDEPQPSPH